MTLETLFSYNCIVSNQSAMYDLCCKHSTLMLSMSSLVISSNHLILCHPLLLLPSIFPSIRVFSNELAICIRQPKYQSFSISPSDKYSVLILIRIGLFDLLAVLGTLESSPTTQFESISSSVLSLLYGSTLTSVHDSQKNHSFDYMDLCWQSDVSAF